MPASLHAISVTTRETPRGWEAVGRMGEARIRPVYAETEEEAISLLWLDATQWLQHEVPLHATEVRDAKRLLGWIWRDTAVSRLWWARRVGLDRAEGDFPSAASAREATLATTLPN
jgi:hypothetical protein